MIRSKPYVPHHIVLVDRSTRGFGKIWCTYILLGPGCHHTSFLVKFNFYKDHYLRISTKGSSFPQDTYPQDAYNNTTPTPCEYQSISVVSHHIVYALRVYKPSSSTKGFIIPPGYIQLHFPHSLLISIDQCCVSSHSLCIKSGQVEVFP